MFCVLLSEHVLLNSEQRYRVPLHKYNYYKNSFTPVSVELINERMTRGKQGQRINVGNFVLCVIGWVVFLNAIYVGFYVGCVYCATYLFFFYPKQISPKGE